MTAFRRCTELLAPIIDSHGIGAVTCYTGNPLAHSFSLGRYTGVLLGMSGIPLSYSPGTVDQWPKNLSSHLMYGGWWSFPVPDVERTDLLVVMGANPAASQGSLMAAPDVMGIIDGIRKRGKVIVIDPVRTATAARADEWLPITPGTDAALLLAVAHTLFAEDLVDARRPRTPHRRARPDARSRRRVVARTRRRRHQHRRRAHPRTGARTRRDSARGGLRPDRHLQPGVRQPRELARRRREHPVRPFRRRGRFHVPPRRRMVGHRAADTGSGGRGCRSSAGSAPASAAPRKYSGRCPCRVWPRRSPPRETARSRP